MTATSTAGDPPVRPAPDRHSALSVAVARIRTGGGQALPVEQILLAAGAVLIPLGLVLVLLGWDGAAHNGRPYSQMSYLISGGLLGLGLTAVGCFMYFGYWLSRLLGESRRQADAAQQSLRRIEELLEASLASGTAMLVGPTAVGRNGSARGSRRRAASPGEPTGEVPVPLLLATPKGTLLHRRDCPVVAKREDVRRVPAGTEGYRYCTMCGASGVFA
ncbi:MAG TPA: hypothetical protein VKU88_12440 [Acidimicrobiales bacterium]|nr:hypothetical protein [Acidimicrobiales bacterium]